jgi:hypothetical protein
MSPLLPSRAEPSRAGFGDEDVRDLSPYELGMLTSSMSPGSAARMMGRSEAWVLRMRDALATSHAAQASEISGARQESPNGSVVAPATRSPAPGERKPAPEPAPQRPAPASSFPPPAPPRTFAAPAPARRWTIRPRKLRFCRQFLAAGWPLEEVASLFDVHADELAEAIA